MDDKKRNILIAVAGVLLLIGLFLIVRGIMSSGGVEIPETGAEGGEVEEGVDPSELRLR